MGERSVPGLQAPKSKALPRPRICHADYGDKRALYYPATAAQIRTELQRLGERWSKLKVDESLTAAC